MNVQAILARHFQPAGVLGVGNPVQLERDLRRCARLNAVIYGVLVTVLVAAVVGLASVIIGDVSAGNRLRPATFGVAALSLAAILGIRRTVREWSEALLLARLSRRMETPQLHAVIEKLIDVNRL